MPVILFLIIFLRHGTSWKAILDENKAVLGRRTNVSGSTKRFHLDQQQLGNKSSRRDECSSAPLRELHGCEGIVLCSIIIPTISGICFLEHICPSNMASPVIICASGKRLMRIIVRVCYIAGARRDNRPIYCSLTSNPTDPEHRTAKQLSLQVDLGNKWKALGSKSRRLCDSTGTFLDADNQSI